MENYLLKDLDIASNIRENGEKYFSSNKVSLLSSDGEKYVAEIKGSKTYKTSITVKNRKIVSFFCDCPYPHICKHVVALSYLALEHENNTFEMFAKKIKQLSFKNSLDEFKGLPYKIVAASSSLKECEYTSLISLYLSEMVKSDFFYEEENLSSRLEVFESKKKLSDELFDGIIKESLHLLKGNYTSTNRFLSSLLKNERSAPILQRFIVSHIDDKEYSLASFFGGIEGKNLPKDLLPDFVVLLIKYSPRVLSKEDLILAKKHFEKEDMPDDALSVMHALLKRNDPSLFDDLDFEYLCKNGLSFEAKNISFALLKMSDDFSLYIRYRKLFTDKEFYNVRYQVENAISYKKYLNSVLLFDGKLFFPSLYEEFSYLKLNPYEVFLAKDLIREPSDIHILAEKAHQYIKGELNRKNRNKDYFYYLLYLDFLKDESISFYLFDKNVLEDKKDVFCRGIWIYLVKKHSLLSRTEYMPYLGDNYVSD